MSCYSEMFGGVPAPVPCWVPGRKWDVCMERGSEHVAAKSMA